MFIAVTADMYGHMLAPLTATVDATAQVICRTLQLDPHTTYKNGSCMPGVNNEEHLRAFLVDALLTWLVLDFGAKSRFKKFTQKEQVLF